MQTTFRLIVYKHHKIPAQNIGIVFVQANVDKDDIRPDVASAIDAGDVLKSESKYKLSLKQKRKRADRRVKRMASFKPTEFINSPIFMETLPSPQHLQGIAFRYNFCVKWRDENVRELTAEQNYLLFQQLVLSGNSYKLVKHYEAIQRYTT